MSKEASDKWRRSPQGIAWFSSYNKKNAEKLKKRRHDRYVKNKVAHREYQKAWAKTPSGIESTKRGITKWRKSPKGRAWEHKSYLRNKDNPSFHARLINRIKKYMKTPKGKALSARHGARRRALLSGAGSNLTAAEWQMIKAVHLWSCAYCGDDKSNLTMDHVVPLSRGGKHVSGNIVPSCQSCNSRKHNKMLSEWNNRGTHLKEAV